MDNYDRLVPVKTLANDNDIFDDYNKENIYNNNKLESNNQINKLANNTNKEINTSNYCKTELVITNSLINDIERTYLTTPYYKTLTEISDPNVVFGPEYNYSNYDIFCLNKNLNSVFSSLGYTFDYISIEKEGKLHLCIKPRKNNNTIIMSDKLYYTLQNEVIYVCAKLYHYCLLFDPSDNNTGYPNNWLYNVFDEISIKNKYNPKFLEGKLYIKLDENTDYSSTYESANNDFLDTLETYYSNGVVSCNLDFATRWNLVNLTGNLYLPTWNDTRLSNDRAYTLISILQNKVLNLKIVNDTYLRHYLVIKYNAKIAAKIKNEIAKAHKAAKDEDYLIFDDMGVLKIKPYSYDELYDLIKSIGEYNTIIADFKYHIATFDLSSEYKCIKYLNYVNDKYPNKRLEVCIYRTLNSRRPFTLSIFNNLEFGKIDLEALLNELLSMDNSNSSLIKMVD